MSKTAKPKQATDALRENMRWLVDELGARRATLTRAFESTTLEIVWYDDDGSDDE
jgi:hypothetical protein